MKNLRIYEIFVDRFSTGNPEKDRELSNITDVNFLGGNLKGIIKKLNYIKDLGFNAIYLTPIFKNSGLSWISRARLLSDRRTFWR